MCTLLFALVVMVVPTGPAFAADNQVKARRS